jgi:capsular polysaccharide export protein
MVVVALCESLIRYRFFCRFIPQIKARDGRLIVLSNRLSVVRIAQRDGFDARLVRGSRNSATILNESLELYEVSKGLLSQSEAECIVGQVDEFCSRFFREISADYFFAWNGSSLVARVMAAYVRGLNVRTLFFEIGNFPSKLFVDPEGVNIRSWFAKNYKTLERSHLDMDAFALWRDHYLGEKRKSHTVQQAQTSMSLNWCYPLDCLGFYGLSAPSSERPDVLRRTWNFVRSKILNYDFDVFTPHSETPYVFFPMQVSTDTQLLWNSPVDNFTAVKKAVQIAEQNGCRLVVKPHPAEINRVEVIKLASLRDDLGFAFVDGNTFEILEHCQSVVTINSTVGMEAMLCDKPVCTLGMAMYSEFSLEDIALYLQCYLLDIDRFSDEPFDADQIEIIFGRAEINRLSLD